MPPRRPRNQGPNGSNPDAVYGPRSALTSFLREQGITGPGASFTGRVRHAQDDTATAASNPASASTSTTAVNLTTDDATTNDNDDDAQMQEAPVASTSSSYAANGIASTSSAAIASGSGSASPASSTAGTKRKSKTVTTTTKTLTKAQQEKKHKMEQRDEFMLAGRPEGAPKKGRYENRAPGSIAVCSECGKKFTVSKYTASNPNGPGLLCSPCTSESIEDRASFPAAIKPKTKPQKKKAQKLVDEGLYKPVVTLQQSCLSVIGQCIDNVEALGDIGPANLDRVAKIVCKNRALNGDNLKLFLEVGHRELSLYDCTNIKDTDLASISIFCPHLERLTLNLCGRLDDDVLEQWGKGLREMRHLSLYAPYLVTANKWKDFFEKRAAAGLELDTFELRMSSRFNEVSLVSLVQHNPNLSRLRLSEIGRFTDDSLKYLYPLKGLRALDISRLGTQQGTVLEDDDVIALLKEVGGELDELTLDGNINLTERVLVEGVKPYCPHLRSLSLSDLSEIEPHGFETLFARVPVERPAATEDDAPAGDAGAPDAAAATAAAIGTASADASMADAENATTGDVTTSDAEPFKPWVSPGLTHLNLHRVLHLTPAALEPLLVHSGSTLEHLSLHSLDELSSSFLFTLAEKCPNLKVLDISFVRSVDNFVVGKLWKECTKLKTLFVHGNNRVTSDVPRKRNAQLRGLENAVHSEIPSDVVWES